MSAANRRVRSFFKGTRCLRQERNAVHTSVRSFYATSANLEGGLEQTSADKPQTSILDPSLVHTPKLERRLLRTRSLTPVGSRRRRAALQAGSQVPFEELPYQCFQEARKILGQDREEKIKQIETQRARIRRLRETQVEPQSEYHKERRLTSMTDHLEELKIWADMNDPIVKKRFEDGQGMKQSKPRLLSSDLRPDKRDSDPEIECSHTDNYSGDMNKPIYRFLADREWRSYKRNLLMQRITQMTVTPDVLPSIDPTASVDLAFGRRTVQPGEFVDSRVSEMPARLKIQVYDKGERMVTIVVVNPDVPNVAKDGFDYRCHFLACNIKVSPTTTSIPLTLLDKASQIALPWLPAYTQKGAPYNRMSIFVLQQQDGQEIDVKALKKKNSQREGFILKAFVDRHTLKPIGVNLFRSHWDEGTAGVMQRAGVPGHDVEFKRMKVEPLPYKKLPGSRYR